MKLERGILHVRTLASITLSLLVTVPRHFISYLFWRGFSGISASSGFISQGKASIHYVRYGRGVPVILLHGGLSHRLSWFAQVPTLVRRGYQPVLVSTRGHGRSSPGVGSHDYAQYARDVVAVMDGLGLDAAHLLGWSDGGNTALMFAIAHPDRVRRMVLVSANFHFLGQAIADGGNACKSPTVKRWIKRLWTGAGNAYPMLEKQIHEMWRSQPSLTETDLARIYPPTLVMTGEHDCIELSHSQALAGGLPNGKLVVIGGAGHAAPATHPGKVNALIINFLKDTD